MTETHADRPIDVIGFTKWPQDLWSKYRPNVAAVYLAISSYPADKPLANSAIAAKARVGHRTVDRAKAALIAGCDLERTYSLEAGGPARHRFPTAVGKFNYDPLPNWLWDYHLDPEPLMLWLALRHFAGLQHGCIAGVRELAEMTRVGKDSVGKYRQVLVDNGLVRIEERGQHRSDRCILLEPVADTETTSTGGYSAVESPVDLSTCGVLPAVRGVPGEVRGIPGEVWGCPSSGADNRLSKTDNQTDSQHDSARAASPHGSAKAGSGINPGIGQDLVEALASNRLEEARESLPGKNKTSSAPISSPKNIFGRQAIPPGQPFPSTNPAMKRIRASLDRDKSVVAQNTEHHTAESVEGHTHCGHCGREEVSGIDRFQRPICMRCHGHGLGHVAPTEPTQPAPN